MRRKTERSALDQLSWRCLDDITVERLLSRLLELRREVKIWDLNLGAGSR